MTETSATSGSPERAPSPPATRALIPLAVGLLVTLAIYIIASSLTPDPTSQLFGTSGAGTYPLKSALASGVLAFAAFQLYTALWIFGKINRRRPFPKRLGVVHRASGYSAIVLSLPVAYNCLVAYGFEHFDRRVLVHALAGSFFYGAFAAKIVIVRSKRLPGWTLPAAGGTLITMIAILWYSAALWNYNNFNSPGLSSGPIASSGSPAGVLTPATGGFVQVAYKDIAIDPASITVHVGQKVQWTNYDGTIHNVISQAYAADAFMSPDLGQGKTYVFTMTHVGVSRYVCTFHPATMVGTISVVP